MVLFGYLLLAAIVAGVLCYAVIALLPDGVSLRPESDRAPFTLPPDRRMDRTDLDRVRIPVSVRGYRFAETDDLLDRLAAEIAVRDEEIARLRTRVEPAVNNGEDEPGPRTAGNELPAQPMLPAQPELPLDPPTSDV